MDNIIEISGLCKRFKEVAAVDNITFKVKKITHLLPFSKVRKFSLFKQSHPTQHLELIRRKPLLLLRFDGVLLFRFATRQF